LIKLVFTFFCIGKLFSPKLYIINLAWLGFEIALLKGLIRNWVASA